MLYDIFNLPMTTPFKASRRAMACQCRFPVPLLPQDPNVTSLFNQRSPNNKPDPPFTLVSIINYRQLPRHGAIAPPHVRHVAAPIASTRTTSGEPDYTALLPDSPNLKPDVLPRQWTLQYFILPASPL